MKTREKNKGKTREKQGKTREKRGKQGKNKGKTREINFPCFQNKGKFFPLFSKQGKLISLVFNSPKNMSRKVTVRFNCILVNFEF